MEKNVRNINNLIEMYHAAMDGDLPLIQKSWGKILHVYNESLQNAAFHGHVKLVQFLMEQQLSIDKENALLSAYMGRNPETIAFIKARGVDFEAYEGLLATLEKEHTLSLQKQEHIILFPKIPSK